MSRANDPSKAKQMELDGEWHWERGLLCYSIARRHLYDLKRNYFESAQSLEDNVEVYIDLHGLQSDEALEYIEPILWRQDQLGRRLIYIITGTNYSKNSKDKVSRAVKNWLNSWQYVFREFSLNGDNSCYSAVGVLGVDPASYVKDTRGNAPGPAGTTTTNIGAQSGDVARPTGKVKLLKRVTDKDEDKKS